jgi:hypothetical protein
MKRYVRRGDSNKIIFQGDWPTTYLEQPDLPQIVVIESPAIMENVLEYSSKTNHTGNFSVLQYYLKKVTKMEQRVVLHIVTSKNSWLATAYSSCIAQIVTL